MYIYNLIVKRKDELLQVHSFTKVSTAYRFIDAHIKRLDKDEKLDKGYNEADGTVLYHYIGLMLEIKLIKVKFAKAKR